MNQEEILAWMKWINEEQRENYKHVSLLEARIAHLEDTVKELNDKLSANTTTT